jgi:hypothetical protein
VTEVPDPDHLMRYVPRSRQLRDRETDAFRGVLGSAFNIRDEDKGGLSVTWIEHYGLKSEDTIRLAGTCYRDSLPSRKLNRSACFSIGNADAIREAGMARGKRLRLIPAPDGPNSGHVEIHRFNDQDKELLDALAMDVFVEHVPVAQLGK